MFLSSMPTGRTQAGPAGLSAVTGPRFSNKSDAFSGAAAPHVITSNRTTTPIKDVLIMNSRLHLCVTSSRSVTQGRRRIQWLSHRWTGGRIVTGRTDGRNRGWGPTFLSLTQQCMLVINTLRGKPTPDDHPFPGAHSRLVGRGGLRWASGIGSKLRLESVVNR